MTIKLNNRQIVAIAVLFMAMYFFATRTNQAVQYPTILKTSIDSTFTIRPL